MLLLAHCSRLELTKPPSLSESSAQVKLFLAPKETETGPLRRGVFDYVALVVFLFDRRAGHVATSTWLGRVVL